MMKILGVFLMFVSLVFGDNILKVASYNVENLFDLKSDGYRYKEYKPNTKSLWNKKTIR